MLWSLMEDLTLAKSLRQGRGLMLQVIYSTMAALLLTEGDRRMAKVEPDVEKEDEHHADLYFINGLMEDLKEAQ